MHTIYISIGSNIDPEQHIRSALAGLRTRYTQLRCSSIYQSHAVGFDGADFLNLVVEAKTDATIRHVVEFLHDLENQNGRERGGERFSSRTLDLDLLLYDNVVLDSDRIQLPRSEITEQAFVLLPLAELAPRLRHPLLGKTMGELWNAFDKTDDTPIPVQSPC